MKTLYLYYHRRRLAHAAIAHVPPTPPVPWTRLVRVPMTGGERPAWRMFGAGCREVPQVGEWETAEEPKL